MRRDQAKNGSSAKFLRAAAEYKGDGCLIWPYGSDGRGYGRAFVTGFKTRLAHRIMCEMRHGPAPAVSAYARHTCGKGHNGCVNPNHLVWGTAKENSDDKITHGTKPVGARTGCAVLTEDKVADILRLRQTGKTYSALGQMFGVATGTIQAIAERRTWRHVVAS